MKVCSVVALAAVALLALSTVATPVRANKCTECKLVVTLIEGWLAGNKTAAAIETDLEKACATIPDIGAICTTLVDFGIPKVIGWLEDHETPTTVCDKIHLCANTTKVASFSMPKPLKKSGIRKVASEGECEICTYVIGAMESWIAASSTEQEIEAALNHLCAIVPGFESTCDAIVAAGVPTVISWIESSENATQVCTLLGACASPRIAKVNQVKNFGDDCSECQTVVGAMEHWLAQNFTVVWIENELENLLCKIVPAFEATCDAIAEAGVPTVIEWIEEAEDPKTVCTQLSLCSTQKGAHGRVAQFLEKMIKKTRK